MLVFRADPSLPSIDEPKYTRSNVAPDTKFWTMITNMENPPEWAVYFGLVKPRGPIVKWVSSGIDGTPTYHY